VGEGSEKRGGEGRVVNEPGQVLFAMVFRGSSRT